MASVNGSVERDEPGAGAVSPVLVQDFAELIRSARRLWALAALVVAAAATGIEGIELDLKDAGLEPNAQQSWAVAFVFLIIVLTLVSKAATGRFTGWLVDRQDRVSLARFQFILWFLLVGSALAMAAIFNVIEEGFPEALDIGVDRTIWLMVAVSGATAILVPLIPGRPTPQITAAIAAEVRTVAPLPRQPSWIDMVSEEGTAASARIDLWKLQLFLMTLAAALICGAEFWQLFEGASAEGQVINFPKLTYGFVILFALSHAGYLLSRLIVLDFAGMAASPARDAVRHSLDVESEEGRRPDQLSEMNQTEAIALYFVYRRYIEHEDTLINNRASWLITIQSFLLATFGFAFQKMYEIAMDPKTGADLSSSLPTRIYFVFLIALCVIGFVVAIISLFSIKAAGDAVTNLHAEWTTIERRFRMDYRLPTIIGGGLERAQRHGHWFPVYLPGFFVVMWLAAFIAICLISFFK